MTHSTEMNNIIEERHHLCKYLYLIKKEVDKRIKEKKSSMNHINIFAKPCHIKKLFGDFLKTPQYTEIATLEGHNADVICFTHFKNKLYSGSRDTTIRIWNTETHEEIAILRGHTQCVYSLTFYENNLYSGSNDNTIRVWKI